MAHRSAAAVRSNNRSTNSNNNNEGNPWLQLPDVFLKGVLSRLNLRDHVRIGAACEFLQKYAMIDNPPSSKSICWVPSDNPRHLLNSFLCRHNGLVQRDLTESDQNMCLGFLQGWLVIEQRRHVRVRREPFRVRRSVLIEVPSKVRASRGSSSVQRSIYLFHRISGDRVQLPELPRGQEIFKAVLSEDPGSDECIVAIVDENFDTFLCRRPRQHGARWVRYGEETDSDVHIMDVAVHGRLLWTVTGRCIVKIPLDVAKPQTERWTLSPKSEAFLLVWDNKVWAAIISSSRRSCDVWELRETVIVRRNDLQGRALLLTYFSTNSIIPAEEMWMAERDSIYLFHGIDHASVYKYDPESNHFSFVEILQVSGSSLASYFEYTRI